MLRPVSQWMALALISTSTLSSCSLLFSASEPGTDDSTCAGLAPLRDDFSTQSPLPKWKLSLDVESGITYETGTFSFVGGEPRSSGSLTSYTEHDFRSGSFTVPVESVSDVGQTYISLLFSDTSATREVKVVHENSSLKFLLDGVVHKDSSYDSSRDRVWQIRESDGTIFFETGPSEADLQVRTQSSAFGRFDPAHVRVRLGVSDESEKSGSASFGGVNLSDTPTSYCPATSLVDSFDGITLDSIWRRRPQNCLLEIGNGIVAFERLTGTGSCLLGTNRGFSLTNSSVELRLAAPTNASQEGRVILSVDRGETHARVHADSTHVWSELKTADGNTVMTGRVELQGVKVLRLWHDGENLIWEVEGAEGVTRLESKPAPFDLDGLTLAAYANPVAEGPKIEFSGLNAD